MGEGGIAVSGSRKYRRSALLEKLVGTRRSRNTKEGYGRDLEDFFRTALGSPPSENVVRRFLNMRRQEAISLALDFKASLLERGLAQATVNRKLAALRSLVKLAHVLGICAWQLDGEAVPDEKVRAYRDTTGVGPDKIRVMLGVPDRTTLKGKRDYAILLLLWENALRRSELAACDVADFDPEERALWILGKGRGREKDKIDLSDAAVAAIVDYLKARGAGAEGGPLFASCDPTGKGDGRITPQGIYQVVRETARRAGIRKPMSPHRIRHSAITAALEATGGDVRLVQRFSRHSKLDTLQIYDDNRRKLQRQVTALLSSLVEESDAADRPRRD